MYSPAFIQRAYSIALQQLSRTSLKHFYPAASLPGCEWAVHNTGNALSLTNAYEPKDIKYHFDTKTPDMDNMNIYYVRDPHSQSIEEGRRVRVRGSGSPMDAASAEHGEKQDKPNDFGSGIKEGVGFLEQVGSASGTARKFEAEHKKKQEGHRE